MNIISLSVGILGTNCYILCSKDKSCAIIDPGAQPEKIIDRIEAEGLRVAYVLLTHGHHDHIGGVKQIAAKYPEANIYIGKRDLEMLNDTSKSLAAMRGKDTDDYIIDTAGTVTDGQELALDELIIRVIETPGHTKGGVCYLCGDAMFAGDTLFHSNVGRCDLYGGDYEVMKKSLKKLAELTGDYSVYTGHGECTTLAFERAHNPYIAEACS